MSSTCSGCGHQNPSEHRFCARCGTRLGGPCPACGNVCEPDARFCSKCGIPLEVPAAIAVSTGATSRSSTREPEGERKQLTVLFADVQG